MTLTMEATRARLKTLLSQRDTQLYPLSRNQSSLWFLYQIDPLTSAYSVGFAGRTSSPLDPDRLRAALDALADRHPSLRAVFRELHGRPLQEVRADTRPTLEVHDASSWDDAELARRVQADYERPFDLTARPGVRACLYRKADDDHVLLLVVHHTLLDLWALAIVLSDLGALYDADGNGAALPPPSGSYAQFVRWQQQLLAGDEGARQRDYWREQLAGVEGILNLPTDHPRKPLQTLRGDSITFTVDSDTTAALNALAREERASVYAILLAAYQVLLSRYTEQDDVLVGSPVAGRNRAEFDGVVGHFVNMIVLRGRLAGDPTFRAFLRQARDAALGAVEHQDYPFADLVESLNLPRDPSRSPLFQTVFAFQRAPKLEGLTGFMVRAPGAPPLRLGSLTFDPFPLSQQQGQFDLSLWMAEAEGALHGELKYNADLFERATAERMATHLQTLLASIVADPDAPVSKLRLLPDEEQALVVDRWNDTAAPWRTDVCMHQLVEEQADRTPDAVAVVGADGRRLTYAELDAQANRLAWHLRDCGVGAKGLVAVFLDRTVDVPPAVIGTMKAGAGYVPLETHWPKARIETIVNSLPIRAMVTQSHHADDLRALDCPLLEHVVCVDTPIDAPTTRPDNVSTPDDTAYIIFTSGSTGAPKGVEVTHRPAVNLIEWVNTTFAVGPGDRLLFVTSLCFDLSVYDVFGGLASGAAVRVAGDDEVRDPERLVRVVAEEGITFWDSAPPALGQLVPFLPERLPDSALRLVFLSGDWIPVRLPEQLRAVFPKAQVVSLGGATEATIWSNWYPIGEVKPEWVSIPYGKPIQNARYYVLDPALNPCPVGVPGDLYIGGPVLASGYVNDPDMTAAKFVPDPFVPGGTMYRTGDRARFWADGNLEFLGRQDFQVKIRGYRIELGEIETVLALHPGVAECLVMARSDAGPEKYLAAYVVPSVPGAPPTVTEVRAFLREKLPDYMVPPSYVFLDRMPVTPNGKVDRKALPAPELRRDQVGGDYVAPRTDTEEAVAAIVARVLGADRVGVTDDFFELGGNSLRAVQVVHGIEEALGAKLSVSALLQAPTVADLAETATAAAAAQAAQTAAAAQAAQAAPTEAAGGESGGGGSPAAVRAGAAVVTLRPEPADGPPLFLFHPAGGDVTVYRNVLGVVPGDGPVYAVPSRAAAGTEPERESVDAMADAYAEAVRAVAPQGPYRLGGWSMGGVLAYAVAARLEAAGATVEMITLWDSAVPSAAPALLDNPAFRLSSAFGSLAAAFLDLPDDERDAEAAKLLSLPHDRRIPETIAWAKARGAVPAEVPDQVLARQVELSRTHDRLLRAYRLPDRPIAAPMTVVWAEAGGTPMDWSAHTTGGATVRTVPGTNHFTLLAVLAEQGGFGHAFPPLR